MTVSEILERTGIQAKKCHLKGNSGHKPWNWTDWTVKNCVTLSKSRDLISIITTEVGTGEEWSVTFIIQILYNKTDWGWGLLKTKDKISLEIPSDCTK